jgi:DNA gyrase subunit A
MRTREEDEVRDLFAASTHDYILVFTSAGKLHWLKVHEIPDVASDGRGKPVVNLIQIQPDEKVRAMIAVRDFDDQHFVVLATRAGIVKKTPLSAFSRPRAAGIIALTIDEGDDLLSAGLSSGNDEVLIATAHGQSIRFHESDVRPMGRGARGVIGVRLAEGDQCVGLQVLSGKPDILTVSAKGYGKRTPVEEYRLQGRGGSGIINMRASERNGAIVATMEVDPDDHLLVITANGKIIRMGVEGISRIGRATQGVRVIQLDDDDVVVSAIRAPEEQEPAAAHHGSEGIGGAAPALEPLEPGDLPEVEAEEDDAPGEERDEP